VYAADECEPGACQRCDEPWRSHAQRYCSGGANTEKAGLSPKWKSFTAHLWRGPNSSAKALRVLPRRCEALTSHGAVRMNRCARHARKRCCGCVVLRAHAEKMLQLSIVRARTSTHCAQRGLLRRLLPMRDARASNLVRRLTCDGVGFWF
jgi:hypothetical protein